MSLILLEMPFKMFKGSKSINFQQYFQNKGTFQCKISVLIQPIAQIFKIIWINYSSNLWTFWTYFERFRTFRFLGHECYEYIQCLDKCIKYLLVISFWFRFYIIPFLRGCESNMIFTLYFLYYNRLWFWQYILYHNRKGKLLF